MRAAFAIAIIAGGVSIGAQQAPVFKVDQVVVSVNVAVKERNRPVTGLTSRDFRLWDNGVPQRIQSIAVEDVPVDVTLFLDTSGSTVAAHQAMARAVERVRQMLVPTDRFRVLTIGLTVDTAVPWRPPEAPLKLELFEVHGISLIFDAVFAALAHTTEPGRRHLIIALTDGEDGCSVVSEDAVAAAAERSDALLHWVEMRGVSGGHDAHVGATCAERLRRWTTRLQKPAEITGGEWHRGWIGGTADPVKTFEKVFSEFRQSYVLTYSPDGVVRRGWHKLRVETPGRQLAVRARSGYSLD